MHQPNNRLLDISGFTLIELIITLSITSILLAIGVPSFQILTQSNRMTAAVNIITTHLSLARSEAVTRGISIVMCPSSDGNGCTDTTRWDQGFILYVDNNKNRELDPDEQLLRYVNATPDSISINSTPGRKKTAYNPSGYASGYNLTLTFCDNNEKTNPKAVIVSPSGRARISAADPQGDPLDCG